MVNINRNFKKDVFTQVYKAKSETQQKPDPIIVVFYNERYHASDMVL